MWRTIYIERVAQSNRNGRYWGMSHIQNQKNQWVLHVQNLNKILKDLCS